MDECLIGRTAIAARSSIQLSRLHGTAIYAPVEADLSVRMENRIWLNAHNVEQVQEQIQAAPIDITYGGWGQDGHIAYNQTRRHPYSQIGWMNCAIPP